jgi:hypothetical protein
VGRLPVWHVVIAHSNLDILPRTTLHVDAGTLLYLHESGVEHIAATRSAATLRYLNLVDQLIICGDGQSLLKAQPLVAGILGVMERSVGADVRRRIPLPADVVECTHDQVALTPDKQSDAMAGWVSVISAMFASVAIRRGALNPRSLAKLVGS